jgi:uncharacterized protein (TIRG00374 family)
MAVGFLAALFVLGAVLSLIGWRRVLVDIAGADAGVFSLGFVAVIAALFCWSETIRQLVRGAGHDAGGPRYRAAFLAGEFVKQAVPLGHGAGPALTAYTVSSVTDTSYEETFAATMLGEFVNVGASVLLATAGMLVLLVRQPNNPVVQTLAGGLLLSTALLLVVAFLVTSRRRTLRRLVQRLAAVVRGTVGRASGRVRSVLTPAAVDGGVDTFYSALDRAADDRRRLVAAGLFALLGWVSFVTPLVTAFAALGVRISLALALFAVPVVSLINIVPTPGGVGGFELALAAVVTGLTGLDLGTSTAGVLLYRVTNYAFLLLVGGLASAWLSVSPATVVAKIGES